MWSGSAFEADGYLIAVFFSKVLRSWSRGTAALHAVAERGLNHVGRDHEVLVDEVGGVDVVGVDAARLGRRQVDLMRLGPREEGTHGGLVGEIELGVGAGDDGAGGVA